MELEDRIESLSMQKVTAYALMKCKYEELKRASTKAKLLRDEWEELRSQYEKADLQLAELDGRLTFVPTPKPGAREKKTTNVKPAQMTMDQVRALAKRVGIELEE